MRALFVFMLSCSCGLGAINADFIVMPDYGSRGILTIGSFSNIVVGSHGLLLWAGQNGSSWERTYIDAAVESTVFPQMVTVGGINYGGSSTNWIRMDAGTNLSNEYMDFELPGNANSVVTNVLLGGFMKWCVTNATGSDVSFDEIIIYDTYLNNFNVLQLNAQGSQGPLNILAHTSVLGITTPLTIISGGSGYTANDILTVAGGAWGTGSGTAATVKADTVNGGGAITSISTVGGGGYSTFPTSPNSVTGGTGSGASIGLSFNTPSTFAAGVAIAPCKTYFVVFFRDGLAGRCCIRIYDPSNWNLVGESVGNSMVSNTYLMQWPVGYIGNLPLNIYHGPTFVKFDASNSDYSNIVAVPSVIINGAVLNGFHTQ